MLPNDISLRSKPQQQDVNVIKLYEQTRTKDNIITALTHQKKWAEESMNIQRTNGDVNKKTPTDTKIKPIILPTLRNSPNTTIPVKPTRRVVREVIIA